MREIKFRVYDLDAKHMTISSSLGDAGKMLIAFSLLNNQTNRWELMQYTGLKDKNRKEIYEGDIVRFSQPLEKWKGTGQVVFTNNDGAASFNIENDDGGWYPHDLFIEEIVGNIYENPELLNEKT